MTTPDTINAVAAVIEDLRQHKIIPSEDIARALASAGWLRTAEDRTVLDAADAWERSWPTPTKAARPLTEAVRARRVAAGGTEAADLPEAQP